MRRFKSYAVYIGLFVLYMHASALPLEMGTGIPDPNAIQIGVSQHAVGHYTVRYTSPQVLQTQLEINGQSWILPELSGEARLWRIGAPALPSVNRTFRIKNSGGVSVKLISTKYHDISNISIVPEQSLSSTNADDFILPNAIYSRNEWYPSELYTISEPSILRDARIMLVGAHPIQYNPVTRTLRIYDE
ncbi:MAG: hypothetical protein OEM52_14975, partial [bacterium]|nr:hypothetical protein [bacterium]